MRIEDVFTPGGFPLHTYNPRDELELENQLKDYLDTGYKLLSLTGPTKSGKTVLCRKVISKKSGIWVSGGEIREENDFWINIIERLDAFTNVSSEIRSEDNQTLSTSVEGGINAVVAKGSGSLGGSTTSTKGITTIYSRYDTPRNAAIRNLEKQNIPVIIDDFHYIPPEVQTQIIRSLKNPIFEGLRVVLLSVPHRAYDAVKVESEMTGRVQQLKIPLWGTEELIEIAEKGFPLLNVTSPREQNRALADESYGNPQLMQEFCESLCKSNNIRETTPDVTPITFTPSMAGFFKGITDKITSKNDYALLLRGPRQRTDRIKRRFVDGTEGDIYAAVLQALANTGPEMETRYEQIRTQLRSVLDENIPQLHEVSRVLAQMELISSHSEGKPRLIEWDKDSTTLYILDPYFAFFLRWSVRC